MKRVKPGAREADIWIGDLVRALEILSPMDDEAFQAIARTLGFEAGFESKPEVEAKTPLPKAPMPGAPRPTVRRTVTQIKPKPPVSSDAEAIPLQVVSLPQLQVPPPQVVEAVPRVLGDTAAAPLPHQPLFEPRWTRAILSQALATPSPDGPIDFERVIETITRREELRALPRLPEATLRRGVQLLVDQSDAMNPYKRDAQVLVERIRQVVGIHNAQVLHFRGYPLIPDASPNVNWGAYPVGISGSAPDTLFDAYGRRRGEYEPPPSGTVVALITDLGIGQPLFSNESASPSLWLEFAQRVRQAGCPLIAFVPYAVSRVPGELSSAFKIVQWDRQTTANKIRRLVGRAHKLK